MQGLNKIGKVSTIALAVLLLGACGRYHRTPGQTQFQKQSAEVLGSLARSIAAVRNVGRRRTGLRGTTDFQNVCIPGFTVNCPANGQGGPIPGPGGPGGPIPGPGGLPFGGVPGGIYFEDTSKSVNRCINDTGMFALGQGGMAQSAQSADRDVRDAYALVTTAMCLDRLLADSSRQLYAFAFGQMGPEGQQFFQFLMDPRGVNNQPGGFAYNTFNDPLGLGNLFGLNGNNNPGNQGGNFFPPPNPNTF